MSASALGDIAGRARNESIERLSATLLLAPAAGGKTQSAVDRIHAIAIANPLAPIWAVVADRNQATAFQRRLALAGAIGVHVGTFGDLYTEILAASGRPYPVTPEPLIHRLIRSAIDDATGAGHLIYYAPICRRPGFIALLADLFAELKRSRATPELFSKATKLRGPRLAEVAHLYASYQSLLRALEWTDHEGRGWLAVAALASDAALFAGVQLVVDGFESLNPTQVAVLEALVPRARETLITLTGDRAMARLAHRTFGRTLAVLQAHLPLEVKEIAPRVNPIPALTHLEAGIFAPDAARLPAGDHVSFLEAQSLALEAREALRWIKARILRDGLRPDECAVVAADLAPYRAFLSEAAREFGLPLRLSTGEPLPANPAISAVLNALDLPALNWPRRPLLDLLRSPYFDLSPFGLAPGDGLAFDQIARHGQVVEGADQWREAIALAASQGPAAEAAGPAVLDPEDESAQPGPAGAEASRYGPCLDRLLRRLTPPGEASLAGYAAWVEDLLAGLSLASCAGAEGDTAPRDESAIGVFSAALAALVLSESLLKPAAPVSYQSFLSQLRAIVDTSVYRVADGHQPAGCVLATNLASTRGVSFRALAMLGLSEGLLPSPIREDPLLPDDERAALADQGLSLEPRLRSDQQTLFYQGVTRATEHLLLARPYLADDGEAWEPSPYWSAALSLFDCPVQRVRPEDLRPHRDAASLSELMAWSVRRRSLPAQYAELREQWQTLQHRGRVLAARLAAKPDSAYEGLLPDLAPRLERRFGPLHVWSPTRVEHYGACPFEFFTGVALRLEERKPVVPGFDSAQLGSMLHEILDRVYRECGDPSSLDSLLAALPAIAASVFDSAPRRFGFRATALWSQLRDELLAALRRCLRGLAERQGDFRPTHFEIAFGLDGRPPLVVRTDAGPVSFHGRIDRVDVDSRGNLRVVDYKTGSSNLHSSDLREGRRLQLAIYALAAQRCLDLGTVVDGFYWAIRKAEVSQLKLDGFRFEPGDGRAFRGAEGAMRVAVEHVGRMLGLIRAGAFPPSPALGCPSYCPARLFCWRFDPPRY